MIDVNSRARDILADALDMETAEIGDEDTIEFHGTFYTMK